MYNDTARHFVARNLDHGRWQHVQHLAERLIAEKSLRCVEVITGTGDGRVESFRRGCQHPDEDWSLGEDSIFLVASITKPIVALAALMLVERGQLTLCDRVVDFLPEFGQAGKYGVEIRHLLTHSSGLPDMLPDNRELRQAHAPLKRFVERTCEEPLNFPPGRGVSYQSMGFVILGEIIERVTGHPCSQFLHEELFHPLGMHDTALGAPDDWFEGPSPIINHIPRVVVPPDQAAGTDWNWNSRYWRQLGAPWGGLLTTASDLAKLSLCLLQGGCSPCESRLFSPQTLAAATRNQLAAMRDIPEEERRSRPWGLGWRLNWPAHSANFGDLVGPHTYGHWGATGTVLWIDPDAHVFTAILTTTPQDPAGRSLSRLSNAVVAAWC